MGRRSRAACSLSHSGTSEKHRLTHWLTFSMQAAGDVGCPVFAIRSGLAEERARPAAVVLATGRSGAGDQAVIGVLEEICRPVAQAGAAGTRAREVRAGSASAGGRSEIVATAIRSPGPCVGLSRRRSASPADYAGAGRWHLASGRQKKTSSVRLLRFGLRGRLARWLQQGGSLC